MTYNIHPLLVHFPIALLFLYSVLRLLPLSQWFPRVAFKDIERMLLFFGFLGACAALLTGENAERFSNPPHNIVEMHSLFAGISTYLYGALLLGEFAHILNVKIFIHRHWYFTAKISRMLEIVLCNRPFGIMASIGGLVAISLTGLLGGVMVYGVSADPIAGFVLKLLGLTM